MENNGFEQISNRHLSSLNVEYVLYLHGETGARHIHLDADDDNNAFMVVLPTRPSDSTGVAHILEHTTLCGSERYPVRDPFFMMLRRSLNTFMNAFTSGDCTAYPFATQNRKDFDNLLSVYLDAVFFPLLDPLDFMQEGWRLDFSDDSTNQKLIYKGVVYNEMKGAMSAASSQLWQQLSAGLFPETIYRNNSGGEPLAITDLKYQQLRDFHAAHYHPSHAVLMTFGNFPAQEHQQLFHQKVLRRFEKCQAFPPLKRQPAFESMRRIEARYGIEADGSVERKTHALWGWAIGETADPDDLLEAHLLASILLEHSGSPLRRFLETTELADAPSELCGIDDSAAQLVFAAGVEGTSPEHVEELGAGLREILERVASDGVSHETLIASLDHIEMSQRDVGGDSYPYGLQLMSRLMPALVYGHDPMALLDLDNRIDELRQKCLDPNFVSELITRRLLTNRHRVRITMRPDPGKFAEDERLENQKLRALESAMDDGDVAALKASLEALAERQALPADADILPSVTLADVPTEISELHGKYFRSRAMEVCEFERATNGIAHVHLVYELGELNQDEARLLPFFTEFLLEVGNGDDDYTTVQHQRSQAGIFGAYASARLRPNRDDELTGRVVVSAKGLARKSVQLVHELGKIIPGMRLDEQTRLADLIVQSRADAEASITDRGHQLAMIGAARGLTISASLDDLWQGPANIAAAQDLDKQLTGGGSVAELRKIFALLQEKLQRCMPKVLSVGESETLQEIQKTLLELNLAGNTIHHNQLTVELDREPLGGTAWVTNTQVSFCAKAYPAVPVGDEMAPTLMVLGKYLQDGFLHPAIREAGGAYGSGASFDGDSATFRFFSYRDPRLAETLRDFDHAIDWLGGENDASRLQESILGVIRQLDKPSTPAGAAIRTFYNELDEVGNDFRRQFREQVLAVSYADLVSAAERLLRSRGQVGVVTYAGQERVLDDLKLARINL